MHSRINAVYVVMDVLLTGMLDVVINAMTGGTGPLLINRSAQWCLLLYRRVECPFQREWEVRERENRRKSGKYPIERHLRRF